MTKLTTESLEKFVNDIKTDGMCDITDYQVALALRQLLAYEQAAKNPVAFVDERGGAAGGICWAKSGKRELPHGTELYAAPVLPKQPELLSIGELLQRLEEQTGEKWVEESEQPTPMAFDEAWENKGHLFVDNKQYAALFYWLGYKAAPAQPVSEPSNSPVIPDAYVLDELGRMTLNGVCEPRVSFGAGWNACRAAMLKAQQNEPQNIPAQPVSEPYKLEIDMDDANHFSISHLHEIIYGKELIWPEAKLLARFMLDVKQRVSPAPAQESK